MKKLGANLVLRMGFGFFFLMWGIEKLRRAELWASEEMLGSFYGNAGAIAWLVMAFAVVQVLIAVAFFANYQVKIASIVALVMIASSVVVTIVPLVTYICTGGAPLPAFLFVDLFPLLAGVWAIYATSDA